MAKKLPPPPWNVPIVNRRTERGEFDLQYTSSSTYVRGHGTDGGQFGKKIIPEQALGAHEWLHFGIWAIVISTNVRSIRYIYSELELWVMFAGRANKGKSRASRGRIYIYRGVPFHIAEQFFLNGYGATSSMGQFVHKVLIPGGYTVRQITY